MKRPIKIAFITNIPTPYRNPQWEYYSKFEDININIFYCARIEEDRHWKINSAKGVKEIFLKGLSYKSFHFNPGIFSLLIQDFDVFFIGGYGFPTVIISIIILKILNKQWVMIIDGVSPLNLKKGNRIVEFIKKILIKGADAYFANGKVSVNYLAKYGISSEKIFNQYMTVDVDYFLKKGKKSNQIRNEIRQKIDVKENSVIVMYAGRLVEHKGVQDMIDAIKVLKDKNYDIKALIVGDGNYKDELKKKSEDLNYDVIFTGHIEPEEIYKYYYASDIFVLPTYDDPWGLVINEAMTCKLPVIITTNAGAYMDLINNNGFIFKAGDIKRLTMLIEKLITEVNTRKLFGEKSRDIISKWTYYQSQKSFESLLAYIDIFN